MTIRLINVLDKIFVTLVLFLSTGALIPLLLLQDGEEAVDMLVKGDPVSQVMWLSVYAFTLILIITRWKRFVYVATRDKLLLMLIAVALISVLWSSAPEVTLRRDVALIGTTLFGLYVATRYDLSEILRLLAWALGVSAVLSLLVALTLPSYGTVVDPDGQNWQGIFGGGKNVLGRVMALSALVFLLLAFSSRRRRWPWGIGLVLSVGLLLMSNSMTSLATLLCVLVLLPLYNALRWRYTLATPFLIMATIVGGIVVAWLVANAELVLSVIGRDLTLTYRTELWPAVLDAIWEHPWLGYGYGAFWLGWTGPSAQVWLWNASIGLEAVHAHNGFLQLWLDVGLLGLLVFAVGFSLLFVRSVKWVRLTNTAVGLWPLAFSTFILLYNITESSILAHNNVFWVLYVVTASSTATQFSIARKPHLSKPHPGTRATPRTAKGPL